MSPKERKKLDQYYLRRYGVNYDYYEGLLKKQSDSCALCGKHSSNFTRRMHLDHNHKTGQVRGILCMYCNKRRVGQLSLEWAFRVYKYLRKHDGGKGSE